MNAIERLTIGREIAQALEREDIPKLAKIVGMDDPIFDQLSVLELMEIMTVRLYDKLKEIGVIENER